MPGFFKLVIAINVVVIALVTLSLIVPGGHARPAPEQSRSIELKLVPIEPAQRADAPAMPQPRLAIPREFSGSDPSPPRWQILADGSVQFFD